VIAYHHALWAIPDAFLEGILDECVVLKVIPLIAPLAFLAVFQCIHFAFLAVVDDSF
jgi:hypothetical protein